MIFSHFQITFQQAGICISPVIFRNRRANAHLLVNPIPKLTIVLIWKTPACLKFGKTSNRALENLPQRKRCTFHKIWSHRTSTNVCFFGNDRSSHSRIRLASTRRPSTTSERVTNLHITVPAITRGHSWYARASPGKCSGFWDVFWILGSVFGF